MVENHGYSIDKHLECCSCSVCNYAIDNGFSVTVPAKKEPAQFPMPTIMSGEQRIAFIEKAENRTNNAVRYIRSIANLSSTKNRERYDYSDQDIKEIFKFIESEVRLAKKKMLLNNGLPKPFRLAD